MVGDAHLLVVVSHQEADLPRAVHGLGVGREIGERERFEAEVRQGRAEDEPYDEDDGTEDDEEADECGEEGTDEGSSEVIARRIGVVILVLWVRWRSGVGVGGGGRRCLAAVGVVIGRRRIAGGGSGRVLHITLRKKNQGIEGLKVSTGDLRAAN